MRIGLFTDDYLPKLSGVSYAVDITRRRLEELGHEVYVIAPAPNLRYKKRERRVIRFPAVKGPFYDGYLVSFFYPPRAVRRIRALKLDVVHFFSASLIGQLGIYVAIRDGIPMIGQYSMDVSGYAQYYPGILPGSLALALSTAVGLKLKGDELKDVLQAMRPELTISEWHERVVVNVMQAIHRHCAAVIALSRKMQKRLHAWDGSAPVVLLPTGIDSLPSTAAKAKESRERYKIAPEDKVILHVSRLSPEKNVELLIKAFKRVHTKLPNTKLLLVGESRHVEKLRLLARQLGVGRQVIFAGYVPREQLGPFYGAADVFAFPSTTDTQGLVLNEAANAGLPIVLVDEDINEVFKNGTNGYAAKNNATDYSAKLIKLLKDATNLKKMGQSSGKLASQYSELSQANKLSDLYNKIVDKK